MYNGGKNTDGVYHTIINQLPPHSTYIELFGGSGAIIKKKKPAQSNLLVEINRAVCFTHHAQNPNRKYNVIMGDSLEIIKTGHKLFRGFKSTLVYCDPPYLLDTRRSQKPIYKYEFTREMHVAFLEWAVTCPCLVVISAYRNPLYDKMLTSWRRVDYNAGIRTGEKVVESLYINYPVPATLHEYTYLGKNRREREAIQRKIKNRTAALLRLPVYQREALLEALLKCRK